MSDDMVRKSEFGKDMGLMHEAIVTGRKVGADKDFWSKVAHDQELFAAVVQFVAEGGWPKPFDLAAALADWQTFYKEVFGLEREFTGLKIPERRAGFNRLLVIAQGLTAEQLFQKCKELFSAFKNCEGSLDAELESESEERTAQNGAYVIWVRDRVEADEEHRNKSAQDIASERIPTETLTERVLHELKYNRETGKHLDLNTWTLCTGSRFRSGGVPSVDWSDDKFHVDYCFTDHFGDSLRAREVVF